MPVCDIHLMLYCKWCYQGSDQWLAPRESSHIKLYLGANTQLNMCIVLSFACGGFLIPSLFLCISASLTELSHVTGLSVLHADWSWGGTSPAVFHVHWPDGRQEGLS